MEGRYLPKRRRSIASGTGNWTHSQPVIEQAPPEPASQINIVAASGGFINDELEVIDGTGTGDYDYYSCDGTVDPGTADNYDRDHRDSCAAIPKVKPLFSHRAHGWTDAAVAAEVSAEIEHILAQQPEEDDVAEHAANAIKPPDVSEEDSEGGAEQGILPTDDSHVDDSDNHGGAPHNIRDESVKPDGYVLFGDIPSHVLDLGEDRSIELSLRNWAAMFLIPVVAVTALLQLLHGLFGRRLGISSSALSRGGPVPRTAKTLFGRARGITDAMGFNELLVAGRVDLPDDPSLRAWGGRPYVEYYYAPDLRKNIAVKLMDPRLTVDFLFDPDMSLVDGVFCADIYLSETSRSKRKQALIRAHETLEADIAAQIPGTPSNNVGMIAVGLHTFVDAVSPHKWNLATNIHAFLAAPTNLRADVAQSPDSVALVGMWNPCKVLKGKKASKSAVDDHAHNASPATLAAAARVESVLYEKVVAMPVRKALTGGSLIVRASSLPGLPNTYPFRYVALTFYMELMNADLPQLADFLAYEHDKCMFDGTRGSDLAEIYDSDVTGPSVGGPSFKLPNQYVSDKVAQKFADAYLHNEKEPECIAARAWLKHRHFKLLAPPPLVLAWWHARIPGACDIYSILSYDVMHDFYGGILEDFMDAVISKITNSHASTEAGARAVATFEARLSSIPSFNTGFRLYRQYPGGFQRRDICSATDCFFLIQVFIASIGLDDCVIPDPALRKAVLSACEAAAELSMFLKAELLTHVGRRDVFDATVRFLKALKSTEFADQQTSMWAILKFHMLMHIINWLYRGAPACTNSSRFEAALAQRITRPAKRASGHHNVLADCASLDALRSSYAVLQSRGGAIAESLKAAARVPVRRRLTALCDMAHNGPAVLNPLAVADRPSDGVIEAVRMDLANVIGSEHGTASAPDFKRLEWFGTFLLRNIDERFVAPISIHSTVEIDPRSPCCHQLEDPDVQIRDDPSLALLARVVAIFYVNPPSCGSPGDGLPVPVPRTGPPMLGETKHMTQRMFAAVHLFRDQTKEHKKVLEDLGLFHHAVRYPRVPVQGSKLLRVFPLSRILRAVRVFPLEWPLPGAAALQYGRSFAAQRIGHLKMIARCEEGPILVFWPRTRRTFLRGARFVPQRPEGANEDDENKEVEGEEELLGGVEASRRNLDFGFAD